MKKLMWVLNVAAVISLLLIAAVLMGGCGEAGSFVAGVGTGTAAMKKVMDDGQKNFIDFVNMLNEDTAELVAAKKAIRAHKKTLVKSETIEAIESLKGKKKDVTFWLALASVLGSGFFGGQSYANRKTKAAVP